jgi:hypothetical protein
MAPIVVLFWRRWVTGPQLLSSSSIRPKRPSPHDPWRWCVPGVSRDPPSPISPDAQKPLLRGLSHRRLSGRGFLACLGLGRAESCGYRDLTFVWGFRWPRCGVGGS